MRVRGVLSTGVWIVSLAVSCSGEKREFSDGSGSAGTGGSSAAGDRNDGGKGDAPEAGAAGEEPGSGATAGTGGAGGSAGVGGSAVAGGSAGAGGGPSAGASSDGGDGGDGPVGPMTWCSDRKLPNGVVASDYQCLDFDLGLPATNVWPRDIAGGTLALVQSVASSSPNALQVKAPVDSRATLSWSHVGPSKVLAVTLAADLNPVSFPAAPPPWSGSAEVLCVELGGGTACLHYRWGAGNQSYFVRVVPSLVMTPKDCEMSAGLTANDWTRVELSALSTGQVVLRLNSVDVLSGCSNQFTTATNAKVTVGVNASGTTAAWTVNVDNVEASLAR